MKIKRLALCLMACMLLSALTACRKQNPTEDPSALGSEHSTAILESGESNGDAVEQYEYHLSRFSIVCAANRSQVTGEAVSALCEGFATLGLDDVKVKDDYALAADPSRPEILIGDTNQPESAEAKKQISGNSEFALVFLENKIVVQAESADALPYAVSVLINEFFSNAQNNVLTVKKDLVYKGKTDFTIVNLVEQGKAIYNIVTPGLATEEEAAIALELQRIIQQYTGVEPEWTYDDMLPYRQDTYSILVGNVKYPEAEQVRNELGKEEYAVRAVGNKLVIAAHFSRTMQRAGDLLLKEIADVGNNQEKSIVLHVTEEWKGQEQEYLLSFPEFTDVTPSIEQDNGLKTLMLGYTGVRVASFEAYCEKVLAEGYSLAQSNQIADNLFRTYRNEIGELHVAYYPSGISGTLHIFANRFYQTAPIPPKTYSYQKIAEATLHVMSLDYSHRSVYDGHGMNHVYTLEDGRYIVMDGGYSSSTSSSKDAKRIYDYLVANNRRPDGKVVIAAWYLTHSDGDHIGAFESFMSQYRGQVTVEYCIANGQPSNGWMNATLPNILQASGTKLIKAHTGQVISFCNTDLEVLHTYENLYPGSDPNNNDSSLVIRIHQNGHTMLFVGDAGTKVCNKMLSLYGDAFKSDIFQVNHHAHSGGTWEFYNAASKQYTLWTCSKEAFFYRTIGTYVDETHSIVDRSVLAANRNLALKVGFENCFYADGVVEQITFPLGGEIQISTERDTAVDTVTVPVGDRP